MIKGFADIHNHQFAYLGFGGNAYWGEAFGPIDQALPHCDPVHGPDGTQDLIGNIMKQMYGGTFLGIPKPIPLGHHVGGHPEFDGWPRWDSTTHQAVYEDWLRRSVDGGLRLMVALAVNNEHMAKQSKMKPGRTEADMEAVDLQLQAAYAMEAAIDTKAGGPGQGWYRIVHSPSEAFDVMGADKLAVVLGIEVDYLFGCHAEGDLTIDQLRAAIDRYYALGVRHFFPVHFGDNGYAGAAFQNDLEKDEDGGADPFRNPFIAATFGAYFMHTEPAPEYTYRTGRRNTRGLTALGKTLIGEAMSHGMVIDVDHMSAHTKADTFDICEAANYPVVAGHVGFVEISNDDKSHEGQLQPAEIGRIKALGGLMGVILHQGDLAQIDTWRGPGGQTVVEHVSGNTTNTFVQAYLYAVSKMAGGAVAFGTDFNGLAGLPGPRFGPDWDAGGHKGHRSPTGRVAYPFNALATGAPMGQSVIGKKSYDIGVEGVAHMGMLPDAIAELQVMGLTDADLDPLLASADAYATLWQKAWNTAMPNKRIVDGTLLQDENAIYVVEGGARFHVPDMPTFDSLYNAADVRRVAATEIARIPTWPVDGTLLAEKNGAVHVCFQGARFHVPDPATFDLLFKWSDVRQLWDHALDHLPLVPVDGTLLREANGAVHVVYGGARFHVPDMATFNALFPGAVVHQLWDGAVDQIPQIPKDGTLLREANGAVHVVYGGARFHVPDMATFNALFPGAVVYQLWDHAVDQIPLIPADGTAIELGPGGPVWMVRGGQRSLVAAGDLVPARRLWLGAEVQIPAAPRVAGDARDPRRVRKPV
jgi:microsomal dipeptidase-like Zn-dependent dipeptidase